MTRHTREINKRTAVDLRGQTPVRLVASRNAFTSRGNTDGVRGAAALVNFVGAGLDLVNQIGDDQAKKFNLAGQNAALEGRELTVDEKKNDRFLSGYQRVVDERDIVGLQGQVDKWYADTDTSKMSNDQIVAALGEAVFAPTLEGFDSNLEDDLLRASAERFGAAIQDMEQKLLEKHQTDASDDLQDQIDVAFEVSTRQRIKDGTYNINELNRQMFDVYGPKVANEEIANLILAISIEEGDPTMIQELMDKTSWPGGAPAPGGIRKYDAILLNGLRSAQNRQIELEGRAERTAVSRQKKVDDITKLGEMDIMFQRDENKDPIDYNFNEALARMKEAGASATAIQNIYRFSEAVRIDNIQGRNSNPDNLQSIEQSLYTGIDPATGEPIPDLIEYVIAWGATTEAGEGEGRSKSVSRLLGLAERMTDERYTDPLYRIEANILADQYAVSKDIATGNENRAELAVKLSAYRLYNDEVAQHGDYAKAREAANKAFPPNVTAAVALAETPAAQSNAVNLFNRGIYSSADLQIAFGGNASSVLSSMLNSKGDNEEIHKALDKLQVPRDGE